MTVFIDTGVFVALCNADDQHHQRSRELVTNAMKGNLGRTYTSDCIIDEVVTVTLVSSKNHNTAVGVGTYMESLRLMKLAVDQDIFNSAWSKFRDPER